MTEFICVDSEYFIKKGSPSGKLIMGVRSKSLNANCALVIGDDYLSKATCESIKKDLRALESSMVYQTNNNLLVGE